jgi:hypothetical protein
MAWKGAGGWLIFSQVLQVNCVFHEMMGTHSKRRSAATIPAECRSATASTVAAVVVGQRRGGVAKLVEI